MYGLMGLNIYVWYLQLTLGETFSASYAAIPLELSQGTDVTATQYINVHGERLPISHAHGPDPLWLTVFSSMFMHGSWMHLIGNMLYLGIFGDQIEDRMGHFRFLIFYILAGVAATFAQVWAEPTSVVPCVGASGAIAGVLGAYLILHPGNRVKVLLFRNIMIVPASLVLGMWVLFQIMGQASVQKEQGGVAYMAHLGGLVMGLFAGIWLKVVGQARGSYSSR